MADWGAIAARHPTRGVCGRLLSLRVLRARLLLPRQHGCWKLHSRRFPSTGHDPAGCVCTRPSEQQKHHDAEHDGAWRAVMRDVVRHEHAGAKQRAARQGKNPENCFHVRCVRGI